jgi:hypothetical protein
LGSWETLALIHWGFLAGQPENSKWPPKIQDGRQFFYQKNYYSKMKHISICAKEQKR